MFRLASLTWSVPVSNGFGRRLRYLVWDGHNDKLIGIIAIGDPVFNLSVRDTLVGWDVHDRAARLVNIMDAYVLGALPPYNALLGGKMVACLVRTRDIYDDFVGTYGGSVGIISGKRKKARLLAVTTSSSMGRSSVYNRLKLDGVPYFRSIGYTGGWGTSISPTISSSSCAPTFVASGIATRTSTGSGRDPTGDYGPPGPRWPSWASATTSFGTAFNGRFSSPPSPPTRPNSSAPARGLPTLPRCSTSRKSRNWPSTAG